MGDARTRLRSTLVVCGPSRQAAVREALRELAEEVITATDVPAALESVRHGVPELILVAEEITPAEGISFLQQLQSLPSQAPVVFVSESPNLEQAVRLVRAGAYDVLSGPPDRQRLARLVQGMENERRRQRADEARFFCADCPADVPFVGRSGGAVKALETIRLISQSRCNPILLLGETGTGKELAARAVHSWRCGDPEKFVAVNCAALTAGLLESELFGHVKGAFTGADRDKTGLFEVAGDGCILLDEISEMPSDLQAKLLRVLQERTFRKVGGTKDIACTATVIASSNHDLRQEAKAGRFRKDLYYRLAIFPITLPPLRSPSRLDDIPLLAEYFVRHSGIVEGAGPTGLTTDAQERLMEHAWPGNVRELRNVIDRAMIVEKSQLIGPSSLVIECPDEQASHAMASHAATQNDFALETAEREFIIRALKETGWQRTRAAALLGITRATLHAKLKRYDIRESATPAGARQDVPAPAGGAPYGESPISAGQ
jgi:DNA-binding NtrC family response regulator